MSIGRLSSNLGWLESLLLLLACFIALLTSANAASAHGNENGDVVVHVTDEGFEPRSLEVLAGDTVVFENAGREAHWPASDDHPMHTVYPEFDPLRPVEPGTEWSFTFDKPGTWKYHDHQGPNLKGEVVVRENGGLLASVQNFFLSAYNATAGIFGSEEGESASGEEDEQLSKGRYEEV